MAKQVRRLVRAERKRLRRERRQAKPRLGEFAVLGRILTIGGTLALTGLLLATFFTPLMAIEQIRVVGAVRVSVAEIERSLSPLISRPLPTVSEQEIEQLLADYPLIETFAMQAEPPHTLTVRIRERQPVVIMPFAGANYLYDPAGVRIGPATLEDPYPFFLLTEDPTTSERFDAAMDVLLALPIEMYSQVFAIEVSARKTAEFRLRKDNLRVIWGGPDQALLKAEVLESLLATQERTDVTIDVSSPNTPVVTFSDF
jgi:cell division protein FtsQ